MKKSKQQNYACSMIPTVLKLKIYVYRDTYMVAQLVKHVTLFLGVMS